jgi:hypothetical protein
MSTPDSFDADAMIDALSPVLGLVIEPENRAGVATYLRVAARMARLVQAAPVPDDEAELAPVFRPGRAGDAS